MSRLALGHLMQLDEVGFLIRRSSHIADNVRLKLCECDCRRMLVVAHRAERDEYVLITKWKTLADIQTIMIRRALQSSYRAIRRAGVLDVIRLLSLAADTPLPSIQAPGYRCDIPSEDELKQAIASGDVSPAIGSSQQIASSRHAVVVARGGEKATGPVVAFLWLCREHVDAAENFSRASHLGTSIRLPLGSAFIYNAWTSPEHRGLSLVATMLCHAIQNQTLGAHEFLTTMDWTNEPSRRAFAKVGMQDCGLIWRCGRGRWQFSIVPKSGQLESLQIAESAPGMKLAF